MSDAIIAQAAADLKRSLENLTIIDTQNDLICTVRAVWCIDGDLYPVLMHPDGEIAVESFSELRDRDYYRLFATREQAEAWIKAGREE